MFDLLPSHRMLDTVFSLQNHPLYVSSKGRLKLRIVSQYTEINIVT